MIPKLYQLAIRLKQQNWCLSLAKFSWKLTKFSSGPANHQSQLCCLSRDSGAGNQTHQSRSTAVSSSSSPHTTPCWPTGSTFRQPTPLPASASESSVASPTFKPIQAQLYHHSQPKLCRLSLWTQKWKRVSYREVPGTHFDAHQCLVADTPRGSMRSSVREARVAD